jgi:hypothetical protein
MAVSKTGDHLACLFERSLRTFGLRPRVFNITTDHGADMIRMVQLLSLRIPNLDAFQQRLRCMCHNLNIDVKDMLSGLLCEDFENDEAAVYGLGVRPVHNHEQHYIAWDGVWHLEVKHDMWMMDVMVPKKSTQSWMISNAS